MNIVFHTSFGFEIHVWPVVITLGKSAQIDIIILGCPAPNKKTYVLEGDEYNAWGNDDDYIKRFICSKEPYLGHHIPSVDANSIPITQPVNVYDDGKSIHNEADVVKIQTLQDQIDTQAVKLKTIMDLLIKNGNI